MNPILKAYKTIFKISLESCKLWYLNLTSVLVRLNIQSCKMILKILQDHFTVLQVVGLESYIQSYKIELLILQDHN